MSDSDYEPEAPIILDEEPSEVEGLQSASPYVSEKNVDSPNTSQQAASTLAEEAPISESDNKKDSIYSTGFEEINNDNDELAEIRGEGRYFGVTDPEASQPICSNCHRRGHIRVNCKVVVCHACGKVDDHYESQCSNSMVCSNCGKRGHFRNHCPEKRKYNYCSDCDSKNHSNDRCPNIWRSYITAAHKPSHIFAYPANSVYCYNCAQKGHYGDECLQARTSKTPNINGSAFTGDNLPRELRKQYKMNIRNMEVEVEDDYGGYYAQATQYNKTSENNNNNSTNKRKRSLYDEYSSNDNSRKRSNYNSVPPPRNRNQYNNSMPLGPSRPSKSGFLPLSDSKQGSGYRNDNSNNKQSYNYRPQPKREGSLPSGPSQPNRSGYIDSQRKYSGNRSNKSSGGYNRNSGEGYNSRGNNRRY